MGVSLIVTPPAPVDLTASPPASVALDPTIGTEGEEGPAGPPGSGDLHFTYTWNTAETSVTITHNLGKYPSVTVVDSAGTWVVGGVTYVSLNVVQLTFSAPFSGTAYLN
jgi:hypothetical protein